MGRWSARAVTLGWVASHLRSVSVEAPQASIPNPESVMHASRVFALSALDLLFAASLSAVMVSLPESGYRLWVPDGWRTFRPDGAPDILLQADSPDGNTSMQVIRSAPGASGSIAAGVYEQQMDSALPGMRKTLERELSVAGVPALARRYAVTANGLSLDVQALFFSDAHAGFIVHVLDAGRSGVQDRVFESLESPHAPALPVERGESAAPVAREVQTQPVGREGLIEVGEWGLRSKLSEDYVMSREGNRIFFKAGSGIRKGLTLVIQRMPSEPGGLHESLEASLERARLQMRQVPSADLLSSDRIEVAGRPARLLDIAFESEEGPSRMWQALVDNGDAIYWIGLNGPRATAALHREDLSQVLKHLELPPARQRLVAEDAGPPKPAETPTGKERALESEPAGKVSFIRFRESTSGLLVPYPRDWVASRSGGRIVIGGAEGTRDHVFTIALQGLDRSLPQNTEFADAVLGFVEGLAEHNPDIRNHGEWKLGGDAAYIVETSLQVDGTPTIFRYILVDRPKVIPIVSYVAPADRWEEYLPMVQYSMEGLRFDPAGGSVVQSPASAPESGREAFEALRVCARQHDWEGFLSFFEGKGLQTLLRDFGNVASSVRRELPSEPDPRRRALLAIGAIPAVAEHVEGFGKPGEVFDVRIENADQHLVKMRYADGNEGWWWMRRIGGRWYLDLN